MKGMIGAVWRVDRCSWRRHWCQKTPQHVVGAIHRVLLVTFYVPLKKPIYCYPERFKISIRICSLTIIREIIGGSKLSFVTRIVYYFITKLGVV